MHEPDHPTNTNTELAKSRTRFAADRTLMAWIRTSLSLIGFGFGIPTIVKAIETTRIRSDINPHHLFSTLIGLAFISVGMFAMAASLIEHRRFLKQIQRDQLTYESSNIAEMVGIALLLIGVISFLGVLLRSLAL
jgi:putative membrane protein